MKSYGRRSHLAALITAMVACVCLLRLSTAPVWATVGTITEFPLSSRLGGPDRNIWFTEERTSWSQR
jgi:hypothetical protein